MIDSIFRLLAAGLSIWEHKEKNKYYDRYMSLKKVYYEESKKDTPDNARLDDVEFELYILVSGFTSKVKGSQISDVQG